MKPSLSCVVVAFHRPAQLRALVAELERPDIEIVVVNVDDDPEVTDAAGPSRVVPLFGDPGYAAAVNLGASQASAEVVVFISDDALMDADTVRALAAVVASGEADVAVPRIVDRRGTTERTIAALPTLGALALEWLLLPDRPVPALEAVVRPQKWRLPERPERVRAASAVTVCVSRALLLAHPLPETYFLYWEESEWFWRLHRLGLVTQYRPELECRHQGGHLEVRADKSRLLARNAVRCVRRTQGRTRAGLAWVLVMAWNVRLVACDGARLLGEPGSRPRRARVAARLAGLLAATTSVVEVR
jgi:GT2 family glycosyltransferase